MTAATIELPLVDPATAAGPVRFHLSLNVADLTRSIEFFRAFFGVEPVKRRGDYAKFELDEPPLVLSLEPFAAPPGGNLNHVGFRMASAAQLVECQRRLELAGISTQREEGVECCYARQTKFWVNDPDRNLWEVYTFDGDIEHRGDGQLPLATRREGASEPPPRPLVGALNTPAPSLWNHRLGQPLPERLPILDATVDEVALQGSFNMAASEGPATARFLREIVRILKPGGRVELHVLTADRPLEDGQLNLPGPAALVERVPVDTQLMHDLETAGLVAIEFTKLGDHPCFQVAGAELRETRIAAFKPGNATAQIGRLQTVLYKGPFRELRDDSGRLFRRGQRTQVEPATWKRLQASAKESFLFLEGA